MGYTPGTPDILIFTPCNLYTGCCIELKTPYKGAGIVSKQQNDFMNKLEVESNVFCLISNDYTEIIEFLVKYIHGIIN